MAANLVNKPSIKNIEQKNSAKRASDKLMVLPSPIKFMNFVEYSLKCISLPYPWFIISTPVLILNKSMAILNAPVEYFVDNNFFIFFF